MTGELQLDALVSEMAEAVGLDRPMVVVKRNKQCASVEADVNGAVTLYVDPRLAAAPQSVQRKLVAHELAHVLLGHPHSGPLKRCWRTATLLFAGSVLLWLLGVALTVAQGSLSVVPSLCLAGAVVLACAQIAVIGAVTRPREREADGLAEELFGAGFDEELRAWMRRNGFRYGPRLGEPLSTHPTPQRRVEATYAQRAKRAVATREGK